MIRTQSPQSAHKRRGVSLVHLLIVITCTGIITTAAITTIISMIRSHGRVAGNWLPQYQLLRLTEALRQDTHAARIADITTQDNAPLLTLKTSSSSTRRVTYLASHNEVIRTETDGDKSLNSEAYRLPDWTVRFEPVSTVKPSSITVGQSLTLTCEHFAPNSSTAKDIGNRVRDRVIVTLGLDHRHANAATTEATP